MGCAASRAEPDDAPAAAGLGSPAAPQAQAAGFEPTEEQKAGQRTAAVHIQSAWRRYQVLYLLPDALYWPLIWPIASKTVLLSLMSIMSN